MKDFSKIVEEWAMKYKPMLHEPGETSKNQRFFLIADIMEIPEFMGKIPQNKTPCVFYEFMWSARITGGKVTPNYTVYFPVNCGTSKPNPRAAHKALMESADHAFKFLTWLRTEQDNGRRELQQLDLENASIDPYGPLLNGWYTMFLQFSDVDTFNICVDANDYVESETEESYG